MNKSRPNNLCRCNSGRKYKKCCEPRHEIWRANPIVAGAQSPRREVPADIPRPDYIKGGVKFEREPGIIKGPDAIARMRKACRLAQEVLEITKRAADVGVTTDALDAIAHDATIERCAYPSPLGYQGYPKSICTSVNEVICHGIPDSRPLGSGDIVNIDVTVYHEGMHGDLSETLLIGEVDDLSRRLVEVTRQCLSAGIEQVGPGQPLRALGQAIEACAHPALLQTGARIPVSKRCPPAAEANCAGKPRRYRRRADLFRPAHRHGQSAPLQNQARRSVPKPPGIEKAVCRWADRS